VTTPGRVRIAAGIEAALFWRFQVSVAVLPDHV
jgi:hypothetical protein